MGDIDAVDAEVLRKQLDNGLMPVVSPLSADANGVLLNINADTVAAAIGAALRRGKADSVHGRAREFSNASTTRARSFPTRTSRA